jgi:hypothetical protein
MARLGAKDGIVTYRAANGHKMQYHEDPTRPGHAERDAAWSAWCADDCEACAEGDPLPDW